MVSRNLDPGEPIEFPIENAPSSGTLVVHKPDGTDETIGSVDAGGSSEAQFADTLNPGLYEVGIHSDDQVQRLSTFSISRDPDESNLARLVEPKRMKLRDAGLVFGTDPLPAAEEGAAAPVIRTPIWEWLLIGVILFLVGESLFALWISKGRSPATVGASMT